MTEIAQTAGLSRQTLYHHLRMAIESLHWVYLNKQGKSRLLRQIEQYRHQWLTVKRKAEEAQQSIRDYWLRLGERGQQIKTLEAQLAALKEQNQCFFRANDRGAESVRPLHDWVDCRGYAPWIGSQDVQGVCPWHPRKSPKTSHSRFDKLIEGATFFWSHRD
jgi:DNA-binding transcriptional ArsR family regulator